MNSGIVLISFIDEMRSESDDSLHEILVRASGLRLKAVMVTSLTTISGLLPTAYGLGGADSDPNAYDLGDGLGTDDWNDADTSLGSCCLCRSRRLYWYFFSGQKIYWLASRSSSKSCGDDWPVFPFLLVLLFSSIENLD